MNDSPIGRREAIAALVAAIGGTSLLAQAPAPPCNVRLLGLEGAVAPCNVEILPDPPPPDGPTYYVAKTGNNSNDGTEGSPFLTVAKGVSVLQPGDTLLVRTGVYVESLIYTIPSGISWAQKVRIAAYPGESVALRPTSGNFVLAFAGDSSSGNAGEQKYIEIDGIELDGSGGIAFDTVKIESGSGYDAHHIRLQNLRVVGNPTPSLSQLHPGNAQVVLVTSTQSGSVGSNEFRNLVVTGGPTPSPENDFSSMFYIQSPNNLIENCIIEDGVGAGVQLFNSNSPGTAPSGNVIRYNIVRNFTRASNTRQAAVIVASGNAAQVYGNLIYNIQAQSAYPAGIRVSGAREDVEVYNNTLVGNSNYGVYVHTGAVRTVVRNNISVEHATSNYVDEGSSTVASHNITSGDPLFVDAGEDNFQLLSNSPAVDAGVTLAVVMRDLLGTTRPQGTAYDIGAYERVP